MLAMHALPLWAVHLSDGVLTWPWWVGGLVVAGILVVVGAWRIRDEEIPLVAVMTSAFFVASLIHVPVPAGPKLHLLLNGLLGVVLGRRVLLAVPVALLLQAALFGHGGFTTLGVNTCVMALPALLAWQMFAGLKRVRWLRRPWFRAGLVAASVLAWTLSLAYGAALLLSLPLASASLGVHAAVVAGSIVLALILAVGERRLEDTPEFPLGLLVGETAVLATVLLYCLVLLLGGERLSGSPAESGADAWRWVALVALLTHLPLAVVEGMILGFTVGFLVRVKPEMLRWIAAEKSECPADVIP